MDLFTLSAKLQLDKSEFDNGLQESEKSANSFGQGFGKTLGSIGKAAAAGFAAVGTATAAAGTALIKGAGEVAAYGDNIDKMSQKMGMSATAYQEWDAIMQHSGTSIESMARGMSTLSKQAEENSEAFQKLGISQEDVANMSQEELFAKTIEGLQGMEAGTERTVLAQELLGGSAKELGALLNTSAEDTEAMRQKVHELGGVMSNDAVKAAAAYQDSLQDMQTGFDGLKRNLTSEFLPSITGVMDGLTDIFSGNYDEGLQKISDAIETLVTDISEKLPQFVELGAKILESLGMAIIDNLPTLLESGVALVMQLATAIIDNLPQILNVALKMIMTLADGIIKALPELIPAVIQTITELAGMLTEPDTLVKLIMAAVEIMLAITQGLVDAIPQLLEAVPVIILNLVQAIIKLLPQLVSSGVKLVESLINGIKSYYSTVFRISTELIGKVINGISSMFNQIKQKGRELVDRVKEGFKSKISEATTWGRDLIQNFIDGILAKWNALKDTVSNVANTVKDFLGFSEPKEGPLSNFHTYAPDMMELFAKGIRDNENVVTDQIAKSFGFDVTAGMDMGSAGGVSNNSIVINISGVEGKTARELADIIDQRISEKTNRSSAVWA